jgi:DNA-binding SARP family transcriptional activator
MEFRVLGPLEVIDGGVPLELGGAKQRALLAALLLERNRPVSSDRLVDALWEEEPTETARKALQVYVSQLRKVLGRECVETRPPGYLLRVEAEELDLARFERLREEGRLAEALALWRGPPLAEFASHRFAQAEVARLEELRLACLEERIDRDLAEGRHAELVGELEGLVKQHPLRERLRSQLMLALYRSGRQAEALEGYQKARRALVDELGIEPAKALRDLHQAILRQDASLDLHAAIAASAPAARSGFVGRKRELAALVAALDEVFAGHGRVCLVAGEPGIGKSRLAEELAVHARGRGARVLVGRCWEAGGAPAYWPWVQSLRAWVRETEPDELGQALGPAAVELAQILPELRELFPGLPEPGPAESESARFRLFDATAELLRRLAATRPLVLVLDDLHAADAPSLLLLQFVAREVAASRILVLGAYRDVDPVPGRTFSSTMTDVAREPVARRISLGGLSEEDVTEYVELTAAELASPEVAAALYAETEGNPLFVGEMVRLLAEEGLQDEARLAIPQTVRDVIARRLAHLSDECNRVLVLASVLGREFALTALEKLAEVDEDALLETLDEAMAARVVSDVPGTARQLRFAHVLIRDTLYDGLTTTRRVRLHKQAMASLELVYGEHAGPHLAELAHHALAGSELERALDYARRAAGRALELLAYEEAARLNRSALETLALVRPADDETRCELLVALGEAEIRAGDSRAAKAAFLEAAAIAKRLGLAHALARAAAGYGGRSMIARAGDDDQLVPLLEAGIAALPEDEVALRATLLARLSGALRDDPSRDRRDALSRRALELARESGDGVALVHALDGRTAAILGPDTVAECVELGGELYRIATELGDRERAAHALVHRFHARVMLGELAEGAPDLDEAVRIAEELGQPAELFQVAAAQAMVALARGAFDEGERLVATAFSLGERAQPDMAVPIHALQRYTLCEFRGRLAEVAPALGKLVADYPARPVFRCALAQAHLRLGLLDEARAALEELACDSFSALPFDIEWLYGMSLLAETAVALDDVRSSETLYGLLVPWAGLTATDHPEGFRGAVSRYLGMLAAATGRPGEAVRHFEDALSLNEEMGVRPWLARTQTDYARTLAARGHTERAAELREAADATFSELGMPS